MGGEDDRTVDVEDPRSAHHLTWEQTVVAGRPALYGVAGSGPPVVFLHGWALGHHSYKRGLRRLVESGVRVHAPALPGFGGTPDLPGEQFSLDGYARWVIEFLDAVGVSEPVTLIGHSFGGGVAIRAAADAPDRVARLIVINSIGGSAWTDRRGILRSMTERPSWDWGLHLQADLWPLRQATRVLPVILEDALPNLLHNPRALWRVGRLARTANLSQELEQLKQRQLPVVILWGDGDKLLPSSSLESLRTALGDPEVHTVPGTHSWLLADPAGFGEVMTNVIGLTPLVTDEDTAPEDDQPATGLCDTR
jgi:pimeloyl-ACP methyl ester carboxylesterase